MGAVDNDPQAVEAHRTRQRALGELDVAIVDAVDPLGAARLPRGHGGTSPEHGCSGAAVLQEANLGASRVHCDLVRAPAVRWIVPCRFLERHECTAGPAGPTAVP